MAEKIILPKYDDLFEPTLRALRELGGSGSIEEVDDAVAAAIGATQAQLDATYAKSGASVLPDRMSWARSFLKLPGLVANPKRGVWVLTEEGRLAADKPNAELKRIVSAAYKASLAAKKAAEASQEGGAEQEAGEGAGSWSDQLLQRVQSIDPPPSSACASASCARAGSPASRSAGSPGTGGSTASVCLG